MKRVFLVLAFIVVFARLSYANDARIDGVEVKYSPDLRFSFVVKDAFTKDIEDAIKSGMPTSFTFVVKLYRKKSLWFNELMGTWSFNRTVKYDSLKEEYEVIAEEKNYSEKTKDIERMKALMVTGTDIAISPLPALNKEEIYELSLMAKLHTIKLPFLLNYMLFFVSFWDYETGWYTYSFSI